MTDYSLLYESTIWELVHIFGNKSECILQSYCFPPKGLTSSEFVERECGYQLNEHEEIILSEIKKAKDMAARAGNILFNVTRYMREERRFNEHGK